MTQKEHAIDLVRRYASLGSTRNLEALEEICTQDVINQSADGVQTGLERFKTFVSHAWQWMPDMDVKIESIFANEGDDGSPWVGAYVVLRGTPADIGEPMEMQEVWIFRFRDGKIAHRWYVYDETA